MASSLLARGGLAALPLVLVCACHHSGGSSALSANWAVSNVRVDGYGVASRPDLDLDALGGGWFFEPGSTFVELHDGSAHLRGFVRGGANDVWQVSLDLAHRLAPDDSTYAQRAEPREELASGAYVANGGGVDPATWSFWEISSGELFGIGALAGARATLASPTRWCFQRGQGASNLGLEHGGEAWLTVTIVAQPTAGATLPTAPFDVRLRCALRASAEHVAHDPELDPAVGTGAHGALEIPGIGTFAIAAGGELVERLDGTAHLEAELVDGASARCFEVSIDLSQRVGAGQALPAGSPLLELPPAQYRAGGGPIDVGAWRYYKKLAGELRGMGDFAGARLAVSSGSTRAQIGLGAHGASLALGAAARLDLRTTAQPGAGAPLPWSPSDAMLRVELAQEYVACALESQTDPAFATGQTMAIDVPDLAGDFVFDAGGTFREHVDGSAELRGVVASASHPSNRWQIEMAFHERLDEGDPAFPPPGSPRLELAPDAYVDDGGVVDPSHWHYYTHAEGQLVGLGANAGARIAVSLASYSSLQIGAGANGRNLRGSASARLSYTPIQAGPIGLPASLADGDLRIEIHRGCPQCPRAAERDPAVSDVEGGFALALGGIAYDLVLEPGAQIIERGDGSARLEGSLARALDGQPRFELVLEMRERVDPGAASFPPAGSPRLELVDSAYEAHGGTVAPETWHYYRWVEGELLGIGPYAAARLALRRQGPSLQLGVGANGRNALYGGSATLAVDVIAHPAIGAHLAPSGTATLSIDLAKTCD